MSTKIKVAFSEASKWVTSQTEVSSDEMDADAVIALATSVALKAQGEAGNMTMRKVNSQR